jgi:hypothetical protein
MAKLRLPEIAARVRTNALMLFTVVASIQLLPMLANYICLHTKPNSLEPAKCQPYLHYSWLVFTNLDWLGAAALAIGLLSQVLRRWLLKRGQDW